MRITVMNAHDTARNILRSAGYSEYLDRNTGKYSFAKRLGADLFPKFHMYVTEEAGTIVFDLHIDQKQVSYEGSSKHSGEYEGVLIEKELARIRGNAEKVRPSEPEEKKGFFASLFG